MNRRRSEAVKAQAMGDAYRVCLSISRIRRKFHKLHGPGGGEPGMVAQYESVALVMTSLQRPSFVVFPQIHPEINPGGSMGNRSKPTSRPAAQ